MPLGLARMEREGGGGCTVLGAFCTHLLFEDLGQHEGSINLRAAKASVMFRKDVSSRPPPTLLCSSPRSHATRATETSRLGHCQPASNTVCPQEGAQACVADTSTTSCKRTACTLLIMDVVRMTRMHEFSFPLVLQFVWCWHLQPPLPPPPPTPHTHTHTQSTCMNLTRLGSLRWWQLGCDYHKLVGCSTCSCWRDGSWHLPFLMPTISARKASLHNASLSS